LLLTAGESEVWIEGRDGAVWRLQIVVGDDPTEVIVRYARRNP
jgi:hypothetical protein